MEFYDDFAFNPNNFEVMAKEYNKQMHSNVLSVKKEDINEKLVRSLFNKIEYLRVLVNDLMQRTSNADIMIVLDDISSQISAQNNTLKSLFDDGISVQNQNEDNFIMFCNNLKIAINTTSDIIKILIEIKDDETTNANAKLTLTQVINSFLDINNSFVSLFGECRYLRYK